MQRSPFSGTTDSPADAADVSLQRGPERTTAPNPNGLRAEANEGRATSMLSPASLSQPGVQEAINQTRIDKSELTTIAKIGEGAFATVERCRYTPASGGDSRMVAVKKLKPIVVEQKEEQESFTAEVAIMRRIQHRGIVECIGYGSSDTSTPSTSDNTMFLVSELMEGGTLKQLVMKQMKEPHRNVFTHQDALRWCIQIAEALEYLHNMTPAVIHRDLKLENILLTGGPRSSQEAKLSDFGLVAFIQRRSARLSSRPSNCLSTNLSGDHNAVWNALGDDATTGLNEERWTRNSRALMTRMNTLGGGGVKLARKASQPLDQGAARQLSGRTGTYMYMAPEMFMNREYTEKVDVFSFAVVMYELLHRYMMVFAVTTHGTEEEIEQYAQRVASGWRPPLNETFPAPLLNVIKSAWAQNPKSRPSMSEIVKQLRQLQSEGVLQGLAEQNGGVCGCCAIS